ncbi:cation:proton antiporter [Hathewaya histolytica]|uniref:NhaP-type Na+(K+)/H+ antiporter n=1 Tax=Hathewaya histolytica TaxID=1498 RepID=A0A4U9RN31_HATHI|nr:cation:proton antiporter [Hathewaya histolytica]VTQ93409.1 NhaP-type Na+(K+)/H+ antiporter [Hathewaya histolytica]
MIQSIAIILFFGLIFNKILSSIKVPGILGMIILGVIIGPYGFNILHPSILNNSSEIRNMALIIILLRAGLGLNKSILKKVGITSIKMSFIPCIFEGITVMMISKTLLKISYIESGMLGFILAAVSPAVIVPFMLKLKKNGNGMDKDIPVIILSGASIDDIFAITLFGVFIGIFSNTGDSIGKVMLNIPIEIIGGIILGVFFGFGLNCLLTKFKDRLNSLEKLCLLLSIAFLLKILGDYTKVSGLLAIMTLGFCLLEKNEEEAIMLENMLKNIWFFAQIFLFVLIGSAVDVNVGLKAGILGIIIIAIGLVGRSVGVNIALIGSNLNFKERLFCSIAYLPKATVQAAIGAIPLSKGVPSGEIILAIAVLSIIITAPLGAMGIDYTKDRLLNKA